MFISPSSTRMIQAGW